MKAKGVKEKNQKPKQLQQRTKAEKLARQSRISLDKERAQQWAEQRKLRANPVQVVHELQLNTNQTHKLKHSTVRQDKSRDHSTTVIRDLQARKTQLVTKIDQIDQAIAVIHRTYTKP